MNASETKPKRNLGIATQVFLGLGLGLLVGVFFGEEAAFLKIGGDAFIALLQITVIPYVMVALITSLGRLTLDEAKTLGLKAGSVLLVLWAVGLAVVLVSPVAFPDWPSASFFSTSQIEEAQPIDFLQLYVPSNIFASLSHAIVPAIVVFSVLFGLALINVRNKERLLDALSTAGDALLTIAGFVGKLAPYGVFAITAAAAGTIDLDDLGRLQVYIVIHVVLALILSLWVIPGLIATLTPLKYGDILRAFRGPLITAFATGKVLIVLPLLVADSKKLIGQSDEYSDQPSKTEGSAVDILIPAAFPFPTLGAILALMFVLFGGWFVGSAVEVAQYPVLSVAGLASLFGGTVLALPFLFDMLRLPADLFQVFVTVDVIGSRFGTLLAAMHLIAIALIGTYAMQGAARLRVAPLLRFAVVSIVLLAGSLIGIRLIYTYVHVVPYSKSQLLANLHLIGDPQPHVVFREPGDLGPPETGGSLERVKQRGTLRACYTPDDYPSAFFNEAGDLVGFDIEMTHRLARYMGVSVEFLPIRGLADIDDRTRTRDCDVIMSLIPMVPELTQKVAMTKPVLDVAVALIVEDHRRREFRGWERLGQQRGLRIAVSDSQATRNFLARTLPNATPVVYEERAQLREIFAGWEGANVDAVLMTAEEGAAWTILNPDFSLVIPSPTLLVPFAYSVPRGDAEMLTYINTWLRNAKGDGTVDALYRFWMLGQVSKIKPPRWSVIRDVLGWID